MCTIGREKQMTREVMQTVIEETKRVANIAKAPLEKNSTTINTTVHKQTEHRISESNSSHLKDTKQ